MNHKDLVKKAVIWLKNRQGCTIVINELRTSYLTECPDAIGFKGGFSTLIECKCSKADFLADSKKYFRRDSDFGIGNMRYYMAPVRLITPEELPPKWGLLEMYESSYQVRVKHKPEMFEGEGVNKTGEVAFLSSVIRRLEISTAVFVVHE